MCSSVLCQVQSCTVSRYTNAVSLEKNHSPLQLRVQLKEPVALDVAAAAGGVVVAAVDGAAAAAPAAATPAAGAAAGTGPTARAAGPAGTAGERPRGGSSCQRREGSNKKRKGPTRGARGVTCHGLLRWERGALSRSAIKDRGLVSQRRSHWVPREGQHRGLAEVLSTATWESNACLPLLQRVLLIQTTDSGQPTHDLCLGTLPHTSRTAQPREPSGTPRRHQSLLCRSMPRPGGPAAAASGCRLKP